MSELRNDLFEAYLQDGDDRPLQAWVDEHPDQAAEVEAALGAAGLAQSIVQEHQPSTEVLHRSRTRLLARADQLRREQAPTGTRLTWRLPRLAFSLLLVLFFLVSGSGLAVVSAQSLPGDGLYPLKRTIETIQLGLTLDANAHQQVENRFQERRADEVAQLLRQGRQELVTFDGLVTEIGTLQWMIGGVPVVLDPQARVIGEIIPGMTVEVEGQTQPGGWVQAVEIHLRNFGFSGTIEVLTGEYLEIDGRRVYLQSDSQIEPGLAVGDIVIALVRVTDAEIIYARRIFSNQDIWPTGTSTPTPTTAPVPTILAATATPSPVQVRLEGTLRELTPDHILVAGQIVSLTDQTLLPAGLQIGDHIAVTGYRDVNGQIVATAVIIIAATSDDMDEPADLEEDAFNDDQPGEVEESEEEDGGAGTNELDETDEPDEPDETDEPDEPREPEGTQAPEEPDDDE